ncbi:unnamed protein product, partial [Owenia fusiformis]
FCLKKLESYTDFWTCIHFLTFILHPVTMFRLLIRTVVKELKPMAQSSKKTLLSREGKYTGRMFAHQDSLPSLPVPPLQQTLQRYLDSIHPLLSEEEYKETEKIVSDFGKSGGEGPKLQSMLENRANSMKNWLSDWWLRTAYLEYREPVLINVSPGMTFPLENFRNEEEQLRYAAKLIAGVVDYKIQIDEKSLPVEMMGKDPLCMVQYYKVLSSCRIPGVKHDSIVCYPPDEPDPPKHIIVAHNNYFFKMDLYGHDWKPLNMEQLFKQLQLIVERSQKRCLPLGILTAENRNTWAKAYNRLMRDKENKKSLEEIQRSIFLLSLDSPTGHNVDNRFSVVAEQMIHGRGSKQNSGNRWFDKTIQFVVGADGGVGLTYEHSPAEGPPLAHLLDHTVDYITRNQETRLPAAGVTEPTKLRFNLNEKIVDSINSASSSVDSAIKELQVQALVFDNFGKNFIKQQKLSPDAFIQLGFQLAFYRIHGTTSATYETGSTRKFRLGRTDTIHSCTDDSYAFTRTMLNKKATANEKAEALRKAIATHRKFTAWAINGQGIDRHLLGLKLQAIEAGMNVPDIFMDPSYSHHFYFRISTSQVPAKCDALMLFGPAVPDGYGLCYNPKDEHINISITAFHTSPETDTNVFSNTLRQCLIDMHDVLLATQKAKL